MNLQNLTDAIACLGSHAEESGYEEFEAEITLSGTTLLVGGGAAISYSTYDEPRPDWGSETIVETNVESVEITSVCTEDDTLRGITERAIIKLLTKALNNYL